jgi:hypothetical protein
MAIAKLIHRLPVFLVAAVLNIWSTPALSEGGALDDPLPPALSDPSLAASVRFSPASTNAGVASIGPALNSAVRVSARARSCSSTNPCAMATPAADHVPPARAQELR